MLHTGIQCELLRQERFGYDLLAAPAWDEAGVWSQLHALPLNELRSRNNWTGSGR